MNFLGNNKKFLYLFFCYLILYLISSKYMYYRHDPNLLATAYDASRYVGLKNFFGGIVSNQNSAWHLFFTYTLFITILEKLNLINHYVEVQYIIFYFSSFLFYKALINLNFSQLSSLLSTIFIVCNPFIVFWIHTLNHAGLVISLFMTCLFLLTKYDTGKLFKFLFFIFIFLLLKIDGKVFFAVFAILFYKFYSIDQNKSLFNILILLVFFILYFLYLSKYAIGLLPFEKSYLGRDISSNTFIAPIIDNDVIKTFNKCAISELNLLRNHFCALIDNPLYSIKLYSARLFLLLTWINTKLSFKYNFFAFGMMLFLYCGLIINFIKLKFTKLNFLLLTAYLLTILIVLPYVLRGDQKFVFYGLVFIVPLSISGFESLIKDFKTKLQQS